MKRSWLCRLGFHADYLHFGAFAQADDGGIWVCWRCGRRRR